MLTSVPLVSTLAKISCMKMLPKRQFLTTVALTKMESKIFGLLVKATESLKSKRLDLPPLTLRVAGGWVRDKLLGYESHDIDLVVDNMMGYDFALLVNEYLQSHGLPVRRIGLIRLNSEKSKHLETATCFILGQEVDFVNLRAEEYSQDSRIPRSRFGTPLEDAQRRDITINSLFYNLHTREVEDFTGLGLDDLKGHYIRTPVDPLRTFMDDPLRVLRCIRFAVRFDFKVDAELTACARDERVLASFVQKISRERVGTELIKTIDTACKVHDALGYIVDWKLYNLIFNSNDSWKLVVSLPLSSELYELNRFCTTRATFEQLETVRKVFGAFIPLQRPSIKVWRIVVTSIWLFPLIQRLEALAQTSRELRVADVIHNCLRESLKWSLDETRGVAKVLSDLSSVEAFRLAQESGNVSRSDAGLLVMQLAAKPVGPDYGFTFIVALLYQLYRQPEASFDLILNGYVGVLSYIKAQNLERAYELTPLMSGKEVLDGLKIKPGKYMTVILLALQKWQLDNPSGSKENCLQYLLKNLENFTSSR